MAYDARTGLISEILDKKDGEIEEWRAATLEVIFHCDAEHEDGWPTGVAELAEILCRYASGVPDSDPQNQHYWLEARLQEMKP